MSGATYHPPAMPRHRAAASARARTWALALAMTAGIIAIAAGVQVLTNEPSADADPITATTVADPLATAEVGAELGATVQSHEPIALPPASVSFAASK